MARLDMQPAERQVIVNLVLRHGRSYDSVSELSDVSPSEVRTLARAALIELAPFSAARVDPDWQARIADYVLGQQHGPLASATLDHLKSSEAARSWALLLLDSLDGLYGNGKRPLIPVAPSRFGGLTLPSPARVRVAIPAPAVPLLRTVRSLVRALGQRVTKLGVAVPVFLIACALAIWALSLHTVDLREMSDFGLISVLPRTTFLSLLILTTSFCVSLRRRELNVPLLALHIIALVLVLFGTAAIMEPEARFPAAWRHVGVAESVMRTGQVDPNIDAYFNWPGFFILTAFVTKIAGLDNALSFLQWAPVAFNLLFLGPLLMILRSASGDRRLIWLGAWFFYLANWAGQDYFSPQAMSFFLFLVVFGVIVTWFRSQGRGRLRRRLERSPVLVGLQARLIRAQGPDEAPAAPTVRPLHRIGLLALVILVFIATVPSHQLTPFAMLFGAAALAVTNQARTRNLPLLMAVAAGAWISFMTVSYLAGNINELVGRVGQLGESASANVSGRVQGSPDHILVVKMRLVMTALFWGLALLGVLRRLREGKRDFACMALAAAPFPLFALQPYGGEMIIRVYLFTLPFMAFFAAALFYPTFTSGRSWLTTTTLALISAALLTGFLFTRYGNERADAFTPEEVAAAGYLYDIAPRGSILVAGSGNLPWRFREYEQHDHKLVTDLQSWKNLVLDPNGIQPVVREIAKLMHGYERWGDYLIITRSEKAYIDLFGGSPRDSLDRVEQAVRSSSRFKQVYANEDARIFTLRRPRTERP